MKRSKFISALCLLLIAAMFAVSCASAPQDDVKSNNDPGVTAADEETEPVETTALSTVEREDYDGYTYSIVVTNQDKRHVDFCAEQEDGSTLNDLVFRRNFTIAEMFNITITAEDKDYSVINGIIQKDASADDSSYSLYATNATAYTTASSGYMIPINEMEELNTSAPWWDQNALSDMSISGTNYLIVGDICPTELLTSECVLFNKKLFDDSSLEYPYDIAFSGKWTMDKMYEYCQGLTEDVNGDGKIKDKDDLFSITCWYDYASALYYGGGIVMVDKDADDIPYLAWDIEKMTNVFQKIYDIIIGTDGNFSTNDHEYSFKVFNEGRAYFCGITFQKIEMFLRDMNDDYGVLPLPKYEETQNRYQTCVSGAGSFLGWPVSIREPEMVGRITEAMAAESYDIITPSLYNVIVSVKNVRDEESAQMVQLIIRNRVFDISHMYGVAGDDFAIDLLKKKSPDVASYFAKKEKTANKNLEKLIDAFTNIG